MKQFSIEDLGTFEIHGDPSKVYLPSHFARNFLTCLEGQDLTGKHVLDVGCGTGILGIAAAKKGARVACSDINRDAVDITLANATLNGVKLEAVVSNGFDGVREFAPFDLIICNAPSNPNFVDKIVTPVDNGADGRAFLDHVLSHAPALLGPDGRLLSCTGSEQDWDKTEALLSNLWSRHEIILASEEDFSALGQFSREVLDEWVSQDRCWTEKDRVHHLVRYFFAQK
ncbi:methyltransferase [Rhodobacteraceae bacterium]|nr:methyltransferase [Paracoccaceae bacterium]